MQCAVSRDRGFVRKEIQSRHFPAVSPGGLAEFSPVGGQWGNTRFLPLQVGIMHNEILQEIQVDGIGVEVSETERI